MDDYDDPIPDMPDTTNRAAGVDSDFQHYELIEFLTDNPDMRKAAKHSVQQGLYAGGGAVAGGMLLGPVGGLIGGITGSLVGFFQADNYDGAVQQVIKLQGSQKDRLVQQVGQVLVVAGATAQSFQTAEAFRAALVTFAAQRTVRDQVWRACMQVVDDDDSED